MIIELPQYAESLSFAVLVTKYRNWHWLYERVYRDNIIASAVCALNMRIRYAVVGGQDDLAYGLAKMLLRAEPLETLLGESPQGRNLKHMADLILATREAVR